MIDTDFHEVFETTDGDFILWDDDIALLEAYDNGRISEYDMTVQLGFSTEQLEDR
jgi:hypothetical protein